MKKNVRYSYNLDWLFCINNTILKINSGFVKNVLIWLFDNSKLIKKNSCCADFLKLGSIKNSRLIVDFADVVKYLRVYKKYDGYIGALWSCYQGRSGGFLIFLLKIIEYFKILANLNWCHLCQAIQSIFDTINIKKIFKYKVFARSVEINFYAGLKLLKLFLGFFLDLNKLRFLRNLSILILAIIVNFLFNIKNCSLYALNIEEAVYATLLNNEEIQSFDQQIKLYNYEYYQALTAFLPNLAINFQDGLRNFKDFSMQSESSRTNKFKNREIIFEQNLLNGLNSFTNLKRVNKKILVKQIYYDDKKKSIIAEFKQIYSNIYWLRKNLTILQKIQLYYNKIIATEKIKLGFNLSDKSQIINQNVDILLSQQNLIETELLYQKYVNQFKFFSKIEPHDLNEIARNDNIINIDEINYKIAHNDNLQIKKLEIEIANDDAIMARYELLPKISVNAAISHQNNNLYLQNQKYLDRSVSLNINVPIFKKITDIVTINHASDQVKNAKTEYNKYFNFLHYEITNYLHEFKQNNESLQLCEKILIETEEKIKINQTKYKAKIIDIVEYYKNLIDFEHKKISCNSIKNKLDIIYFNILKIIGSY